MLKRLEKLGLAKKLLGAFGIMILLMGLVGWVGIHNMDRLNRAGALLYRRDTLGIERIDAANLDLVNENRALRDMLLASDASTQNKDRGEVLAYDRSMVEQVQAAGPSLTTVQGRHLLEQFQATYAEFVPLRDAFLREVASGEVQQAQSALSLRSGPLRERANVLDKVLKKTSAQVDAQGRTLAAANEALYIANLRLMAGLVIVGVLLSVLLGSVIARIVLRQVGGEPGEIEAAARRVAQGDLEIAPSGRTGIAASMVEMTGTLRDVARQANVIASGDYSADVQPRSDKDELGQSLRAMNRALRDANAEVLVSRIGIYRPLQSRRNQAS